MGELLQPNDDWNKIIEVTSKNLAEAQKAIDENKCNKPKDIGDRVMIWDWSDNQDLETGEEYNKFSELANDSMIIIEKDCINEYFDPHIESKTNRDLVVYSLKYKRKIATCMEYVRLLD